MTAIETEARNLFDDLDHLKCRQSGVSKPIASFTILPSKNGLTAVATTSQWLLLLQIESTRLKLARSYKRLMTKEKESSVMYDCQDHPDFYLALIVESSSRLTKQFKQTEH